MKTIKVKKHEVEKVISLLKKYEGSEDGNEAGNEAGNYHWCALNSIKPKGFYKIDCVEIVEIIHICIRRFGYNSKGINARIYSLLSFYGIEVEE